MSQVEVVNFKYLGIGQPSNEVRIAGLGLDLTPGPARAFAAGWSSVLGGLDSG